MNHSQLLASVFCAVILCSFLLTGCGSQGQGGDKSKFDSDGILYVKLSRDLPEHRLALASELVEDHAFDDAYVYGYLGTTAYRSLDENLKQHVHVLQFNSLDKSDDIELDRSLFEGYHDYDRLTGALEVMADQYQDIFSLKSAGRSVEQRELWLMQVGRRDAASQNAARPKLLYIANMHGDEVAGREFMIYLLQQFAEQYGQDERITNMINHAEIFIMPSMNPDGFERQRRWNARGIDLNRDFPDFVSDPSDIINGRQPETQAVMQLHSRHHFMTALNFHGGVVCVNLPWDTRSNRNRNERFPDDPLMSTLGRAYAQSNPRMRANTRGPFVEGITYGYEWYPVRGGLQDWANHYRRSTHATIELTEPKWPRASQLDMYWQENNEALIAFLDDSLMGLWLRVVGPNGELIPDVEISHSGSRRVMTFANGIIKRPTLAEPQEVTLRAPGFADKHLSLQPKRYQGDFEVIIMDWL